MKRHLWTVLYGLALTAFTAYLALDTFVLSRAVEPADEMNTAVFETVSTPAPTPSPEPTPGPTETPEPTETPDPVPLGFTETTYRDENIRIELTERVEFGTHVYIADIRITSAEYLKTALAKNTYGRNVAEKTSTIAAAHDAILAINGDYYGAREAGIVIRNGRVYRKKVNTHELLVIWADGTMEVLDGYTSKADDLAQRGAWQVFCFGPGLVSNGEITVTAKSEVRNSMASNPRTAIGVAESGHYLFVVSDGRTAESEGLSLYELAELMRSLGAVTAYNLDGGGSSAMVFNGRVINKPTSYGKTVSERRVSDIVYIG